MTFGSLCQKIETNQQTMSFLCGSKYYDIDQIVMLKILKFKIFLNI